MHEEVNDFRIGFRSGYDFKQTQVARRIEEVCAAEMFLEIFASPFRHEVNGNARRVGRNDRSLCSEIFCLLKNGFLDIKIFDHHLSHPIATSDVLHVVSKISGGDQLGEDCL